MRRVSWKWVILGDLSIFQAMRLNDFNRLGA